jgi:hypothetical protein
MVNVIDSKNITEYAASLNGCIGKVSIPPYWSVHMELEEDPDASPDEADCYSDEDKEAWRNGDWQYVLVFTRVLDGDDKCVGSSLIGGVEYGEMPAAGTVSPLTDPTWDYLQDQVREALNDAEDTIHDGTGTYPGVHIIDKYASCPA